MSQYSSLDGLPPAPRGKADIRRSGVFPARERHSPDHEDAEFRERVAQADAVLGRLMGEEPARPNPDVHDTLESVARALEAVYLGGRVKVTKISRQYFGTVARVSIEAEVYQK